MSVKREAPATCAGKAIGPVGYGMLGLTNPRSPVEYPAAVKALKTAIEQGATLWNGSLHYGTPTANSLHLAKHYFEQYPEDAAKVMLSIKGAYSATTGPDGSPAGIRVSVEEAIGVLPPSLKTIDVFLCGRVDPKVPIETSVGTLAELVAEGKIGGIGLSEASAATIRRAHAVHPIAMVEIELSLFTPDPLHNGIVDTCHELQIPIAAYSPIGRGWLTGNLRSPSDLPANDFRHMLPRFQPDNFAQNLRLVDAVSQVAARREPPVTTSQVALGWVCRQGAIPIPGSRDPERVRLNCRPANISEEEAAEIQAALDAIPVAGLRYGGDHEGLLNG